MNYENIQVNTQSSIRIEGSETVYFDPIKITEASHDADVIFITHPHSDHFDPESIENIRKDGTVFIIPASMASDMKKVTGEPTVHLLAPEENLTVRDLKITAVPAYNKLKPFHPKHNKWLGYLLEMDGTRSYVAGDTDSVKELKSIQCDIALVPIGGTYTMNAKEAAALINIIEPAVVIPTHYGSLVGSPEDEKTFRKLLLPGIVPVLKL